MNARKIRCFAGLITLAFAGTGRAGEEPPLFERDIRPILKASCFQCHGDEANPKGGVDLRLRRFLLRDLDGGRKIVAPGKPAESEMLLLVREGEMPKRGNKLKPEEVALIERWIVSGAPVARAEPEHLPPGPVVSEEEKNFWAFRPVTHPEPPSVGDAKWVRNPIDAFIAREHEIRGLRPRPEASAETLLRRVFLDLIGLVPTLAEQEAFRKDSSPQAYENLVDRLLADPRHGERWARHWMDVWRYSDWAGWSEQNQVRDSHRHIWRWRDWIVESLNADKGYDRMVLEMIAGDELAPDDPAVLRATGFLVRNYKMLSREQWMEDTVKHTSQAFLGLTVGCAKCHNHMYDPIAQREYYELRAIFEPHQVRIDPVPGETNSTRDGLARVYDANLDAPSYFYMRGDERRPDKSRTIIPAVPRILGGTFEIAKVDLPRSAAFPEKQPFAIRDTISAHRTELESARAAVQKMQLDPASSEADLRQKEAAYELAHARYHALLATVQAEQLEDQGKKTSPEWVIAATEAAQAQRRQSVADARARSAQALLVETQAEARLCAAVGAPLPDKTELDKAAKALAEAVQKRTASEKAFLGASQQLVAPLSTNYTPRAIAKYPETSTGRRLAFARWLTDQRNPLTARVAANHLWLRHFDRGIVATPADFGASGRPPSHPELLDWLASELMARNWSMKAVHRLIVTSSTYRMAGTPDETNSRIDPDNVFLWKMPSRRLEAEAVRDNLLHVAGELDAQRGGPEIDHQLGLKSKRRSLYFRSAPEREVEMLKVFDGPNVNECYERRASVTPQQALALFNNELARAEAKALAEKLAGEGTERQDFVERAFLHLFARRPTSEEMSLCRTYLESATESGRARERLLLVLFNHTDFVTIR